MDPCAHWRDDHASLDHGRRLAHRHERRRISRKCNTLSEILLTGGRMYVCSSGIAIVEQSVHRTSEYIQDRQVARHPLWILLAMAEPPIYPKLCNTSSFAQDILYRSPQNRRCLRYV